MAEENAQELEEKLVDLMTKLEDAGSELAPQVLDAGFFAVQGVAIAEIIIGALCLAASVYLLRGAFQKLMQAVDCGCTGSEEGVLTFTGIGMGAVGLVAGIGGLTHVVQPLSWLAIFSPEAALVYRFFLS